MLCKRPERLAAAIFLGLIASATAHAETRLEFRESTVAGSASDFMLVRHLVLRGTNEQIGRKLTEIARSDLGWKAPPTNDAIRSAAQLAYFERNYPLFLERIRGVAAAAGESLDKPRVDLTTLQYGFTRPGCTVFYCPANLMADRRAIFSRNLDFTTGTLEFRNPSPGETACVSRPFVLELHPDKGYASIALVCFDLLGGVVDGMNSEGLCVAVLVDDEIIGRHGSDPAPGPQPGLHELQVQRFLLDTCATVEDAKKALLQSRLYYSSFPCHYVVVDRSGKSFIWENSRAMTHGHIFDGTADAPLISTNFMRHLHPDAAKFPTENNPAGSFARYSQVDTRLNRELRGGHKREAIIDAAQCVAATHGSRSPERALHRTLWHSMYYPESLTMEVDFYLGEAEGGQRRSGYKSFELKHAK